MNNRPLQFTPYREPQEVWDEFVPWWMERWPGRALPASYGLYNLVALTGLSHSQVAALLKEQTPPRLLPDRWMPA